MRSSPLYREETGFRKTAALFIIGILIAGLAGYGVSLLMNPPAKHVEGIALESSEIEEMKDAALFVTISNAGDLEQNFTITVEADPIITVYIGNKILPNRDNVFTYSFRADAGDLVTKTFTVHAGSLPAPKTAITFNLKVKVYLEGEAKALTEKEFQVTVKK